MLQSTAVGMGKPSNGLFQQILKSIYSVTVLQKTNIKTEQMKRRRSKLQN